MEFFKFPAGEIHRRGRVNDNFLYIPDLYRHSLNDYIMKIMLSAKPGMELFIPYLPYSRQDRPTSPEEPFSLKVFGDILNTAKFSKVYTLDVHSDVAFGCIDNLINIPVEYVVREHRLNDTNRILVIPDQGATKRLSSIESMFSSSVTCIKHRDTATGKLSLKQVVGNLKMGDDAKYLIVDDICDGGGTFVLIANKLRELGVRGDIELCVSHGILSKGIEPLWEASISNIYTTNSFFAPHTISANCRFILDSFQEDNDL